MKIVNKKKPIKENAGKHKDTVSKIIKNDRKEDRELKTKIQKKTIITMTPFATT